MMLGTERELLIHLALRVLRVEEKQLAFLTAHHASALQVKETRDAVQKLRDLVSGLPGGNDALRRHNADR
jgi:hypothetical protein